MSRGGATIEASQAPSRKGPWGGGIFLPSVHGYPPSLCTCISRLMGVYRNLRSSLDKQHDDDDNDNGKGKLRTLPVGLHLC